MGLIIYSVNYWSMLVAALVSIALGFLWYGPLFGKQWMKYMGISVKDMEKAKKKGMPSSTYFVMFITTLLTTWILALFIINLGLVGWKLGAITGFWIWLGFIVPFSSGSILWERKPFGLFVLNMSYELVKILLMGAILGSWM